MEGERSEGVVDYFQKYVRRIGKDFELKGTIQTAVEGINLSLPWNHSDALMAECIRTSLVVISSTQGGKHHVTKLRRQKANRTRS